MPIFGALMGFLLFSGATFALPTLATAPAKVYPTYSVQITGYNAVADQTDESPFETASGAYSNPEIIAARSRDLAGELPFGTIIAIEGPSTSQKSCGYSVVKPVIGYRIIEDTMNARYTNRIDILFSINDNFTLSDGRTMNAGNVLGICNGATIRVVGYLDSIHTDLLPRTQAELSAIVNGKSSPIATK